MPLQATSGAASYDAFGGGVAAVPNYIEDVFSTYLYTGNNNNPNTITNGINLSTYGGLVWVKSRSGAYNSGLIDTVRGRASELHSNTQGAQDIVTSAANGITSFNTNGFTLGNDEYTIMNSGGSTFTYASWTFRKQPKFFDIVTYTGNGGSSRAIAHSLTSTPGCIIVKRTDSTGVWYVYHRAVTASGPQNWFMVLNTTAALAGAPAVWDGVPTSTDFIVQPDTTNINGATYVAYLFAHNAGGFGLTGTDNVISCGSFTTDGSANFSVNLGYEPQWVLLKRSSGTGDWFLIDNMRGWTVNGQPDSWLLANNSNSESSADIVGLNATGFESTSGNLNASSTYIYIAIRRGPMKVPTSGTSVFSPVAQTKSSFPSTVTAGFPVDLTIEANRASDGLNSTAIDRLRGGSVASITSGTAAEYGSANCSFASNTVFSDGWLNNTSNIYWMFRRAPSFFDEVCYTTDGSTNQRITHNLAAVPELIITKRRDAGGSWFSYSATLGRSGYVSLNSTNANFTGFTDVWGTTNPTSTDFGYNCQLLTNSPYTDRTIVAYLFATCAGVSKVGSYTGNGSTQTIDCGFTGGARFVLIKRTDATGDWYVYDTARGMTTLTDPYLLLNSTAAESATLGSVTTVSTGFALNAGILAAINTNGASYIFLAIA